MKKKVTFIQFYQECLLVVEHPWCTDDLSVRTRMAHSHCRIARGEGEVAKIDTPPSHRPPRATIYHASTLTTPNTNIPFQTLTITLLKSNFPSNRT